MTVFCLAELDGDAVADASLRALTLARGLAAGASTTVAAVVFCAPQAAPGPGSLTGTRAMDARLARSRPGSEG